MTQELSVEDLKKDVFKYIIFIVGLYAWFELVSFFEWHITFLGFCSTSLPLDMASIISPDDPYKYYDLASTLLLAVGWVIFFLVGMVPLILIVFCVYKINVCQKQYKNITGNEIDAAFLALLRKYIFSFWKKK